MDLLSPEPGLVIWTGLTFLILLYLLGKFAWRPLLSAIKEREDSIKNAIESANKANEELKQLEATRARIQAETRQERDAVLREAQSLKNSIVEEARAAAKQEYETLVVEARAQIEKEKADAMLEMRQQVAKLSVQIAGKILVENLASDDKQNELVEKYLNESNFN